MKAVLAVWTALTSKAAYGAAVVSLQAGNLQAEIKDPGIKVDLSAPFVKAAIKLAGQFMGLATVACVLAFIVVGVLIMFASFSAHQKATAWKALMVVAVGAMFFGSISGAVAFFGNINLFQA